MNPSRGSAPHMNALIAAIHAANRSPCEKSKRGAAVYRDLPGRPTPFVMGTGYNGAPTDLIGTVAFTCDGSERCRELCGKRCVHAEARAIREALQDPEYGASGMADLVHIKVIDGKPVAGGPPSCWQCSREILDAGIRGVWLYEVRESENDHHITVDLEWVYYTAADFHAATLKNCELT